MTVPLQKPGRSKQDYGTPWPFIRAVEKRFGPLVADLACTRANCKAPSIGYPDKPRGYFFDDGVDSLSQSWSRDFPTGNLWLNPPFANIGIWAKKCRLEMQERQGLILMLTPASIGSEWFTDYVLHQADVIGLRPRMTFEGTPVNPKTGKTDAYPKDLMLSIFGIDNPGFDTWRWDE